MTMDISTEESFPRRKTLPHRVPAWMGPGCLYFITICCKDRGQNQLCRPDVAKYILGSVAYRQQSRLWFARLVLLMPDHVHMLVAFPDVINMTATVRGWKSYIARRHGIRWQRDFFDHRIRNGESWEKKAHYIRQNPIRAGLVNEAGIWPYVWDFQGQGHATATERGDVH
jgi:REP element-mobilizing transposase RayT